MKQTEGSQVAALYSIPWRGGVRPLPEIGRAYITEILSRAP